LARLMTSNSSLAPALEKGTYPSSSTQEMESLELFVQVLNPLFFSAFHELGDKVHGSVEVNVSALGTSGKRQGTDFDYRHYLPPLERKPGSLDYARPQAGLDLPEC
jgi:hypothetical protein